MVNLVKIRRKAKEKKQKEELEAQAQSAAEEASRDEATPEAGEDTHPVDTSTAPDDVEVRGDVQQAASAAEGSAGERPAAAPSGEARQEETPPDTASGTRERRQQKREQANAAALERLEEFRRTAGIRHDDEDQDGTEGESEATEQLELLVFHLSDEQYAVEINSILEITRLRSITRVPNAEESVIGIISLRGTIVTLLDVRRRLGHGASASGDDDQRIIVVESDSEVAGFIVDRVYRVVRVDASKVESHPVVSSDEQNRCVRGVFRHRDRITILLALDQLLERDS